MMGEIIIKKCNKCLHIISIKFTSSYYLTIFKTTFRVIFLQRRINILLGRDINNDALKKPYVNVTSSNLQ